MGEGKENSENIAKENNTEAENNKVYSGSLSPLEESLKRHFEKYSVETLEPQNKTKEANNPDAR